MARAIRMSYNVLGLDSDVLVFHDPYTFLKRPPLANINYLAMRDGDGWINSGTLYVQGAKPNGPVAYMIAEIIDRQERWAENCVPDRPCQCWEQTVHSETVLSAISGRQLAFLCWMTGDEARLVDWRRAHKEVLRTARNGNVGEDFDRHPDIHVADYMSQRVTMPWPAELKKEPYVEPFASEVEVQFAEAVVPNGRGPLEARLGGPLYAPKRGNWSTAWRELLKSDGQPLYPDPDDPSQAAAGAAIKETFGFMPIWFVETWSSAGGKGYWSSELRGPGMPAPAVLAHFVHVPGGPSNKLVVRMGAGQWNWDAAHKAHNGDGVFFASTPGKPLPDVLAYTPEVELQRWASEADFALAVLSLTRLALEMGRAAGYPAPRCNDTGVFPGIPDPKRLPLSLNHGTTIPYSRPGSGGFGSLRCMWVGYLFAGCKMGKPHFPGGLVAPEYDHLVDLVGPSQVLTVPAEWLQGPRGPSTGDASSNSSSTGSAAWNVTELAAVLTAKLALLGNSSGSGMGSPAGSSSGGHGHRAAANAKHVPGPKILRLPHVPRLTDEKGPAHLQFIEHHPAEAGMHQIPRCMMLEGPKPYRLRTRRRGRQR